MIDERSIENLKNRLDIVEVIGNYLELKKSGANFKSICPFHGEDTPSFVVSPAKQIYHCFGCGAGGDAIKFVMEYEKLTYPEALEKLASMCGIHLNYTDKNLQKKDVRKVLKSLNLFFQKNLDHCAAAKEYLKKRGIFSSSIEKFEIGYAPSSQESIKFLKENLFSLEDAKEVGVIGIGEKGDAYARFIERITFAIYDPSSRLVGFGARTISNHPAKYINSPQTKLFNKSKLLYGYHLARESISKEGEIIITEGYLDVIMLHQAGFTNAVATLGTSLTNEHIPLLRRGEPKIILSYDGDKAGINAALKAASMLSAASLKGGVVLYEEGLDPADMVKEGRTKELQKLFNSPKPFIEFCIEQIVKKYNLRDPLQKEQALKEGVNYLATLSKLLQTEYKEYLAAVLDISSSLIKFKPDKNFNNPLPIRTREDIAELALIKTLLNNPKLIEMVLDAIDEDMFKTHKSEFLSVIRGHLDKPALVGITLRDDIKAHSEKELKNQLCFFLAKYYNSELKKITKNQTLSFEKKNFIIRKLQEKISRLKKGELVAYETIMFSEYKKI